MFPLRENGTVLIPVKSISAGTNYAFLTMVKWPDYKAQFLIDCTVKALSRPSRSPKNSQLVPSGSWRQRKGPIQYQFEEIGGQGGATLCWKCPVIVVDDATIALLA